MDPVREEEEISELEDKFKARCPAGRTAGLSKPGRVNRRQHRAVADIAGLILPICDRITPDNITNTKHPAAPSQIRPISSCRQYYGA